MTPEEKLLEAIEEEHIIIDQYTTAKDDLDLCQALLARLLARRQLFSELLENKRRYIYAMKQHGYAVNHVDGDVSNNELSNLRVVRVNANKRANRR